MAGLSHRTITLISGASSTSVKELFLAALNEFVVEIVDTQEILIEGRVIFAMSFRCDPAHLLSIENDLQKICDRRSLDFAIEPL
jgi:hypothetical protein